MKEYRKIIDFKYNHQKYSMYLDKNNRHLFFKEDNQKKLSYVTKEELILLAKLFLRNNNIMMIENNKKEIINIIPKVITKTGAVVITSNLLLNLFLKTPNIEEHTTNQSNQKTSYETVLEKEQYLNYLSAYDDIEYNKDYYYDKNLNYLFIYNTDYIDNILTDEISLDTIYETIDKNNNINKKYKELIKNYSKDILNKYPDADLRMLNNNLKTLKIIEFTDSQMYNITGNSDCFGFYKRENNEIYVLENKEYEKGTWEYQVIYHELSHVLRNTYIEDSEIQIIIQSENKIFNNEITQESLNSLFAVSLFDYEEKIIAYQLQSNYYSIMVDCIDYDLTNYVNKPLSDFPDSLNEFNKDEKGTAEEILELINIQYYDYSNDSIIIDNNEYNRIIDYLCKMYYKKYIDENTSYEEAKKIAKSLENKIIFNVPDNYNINTRRIYTNLDEYMSNININHTNIIKK